MVYLPQKRNYLKDLTPFSLKEISRKLNSINVQINLEHRKIFPKERFRLLSLYQYKRRFIDISPQGYFSFSKLTTSLIDFSFVRSLVASSYSREGGHCFDPASIFVLYLCGYLDGFKTEKDFISCLHDKDKGRCYRAYAGISYDRIPCESDFTNFKKRIGPEKFDEIFHTLVEIVKRVGLVSGKILSYDGTLFPTFANYRGCNYACKTCKSIPLKEDFLKSLRYRIIDLLNHPSKITLGKERRSFAICPRDDLPSCVRKKPTFAALSFCFIPKEEDQKQSELAYILLLEKKLSQQGLYLQLLSSCISKIDLTKDEPLIYVRCPRMPADLEAKIGYRRSNHNPNKKVKVFGYQAMITTNIELEIGLELPVGCVTSPADKLDGSYLIPEREKFIKEHGFLPYFDIGDCGFDIEKNFHRIRSTYSIPIIDYNKRGEKTDIKSLMMRGYDEKGTPFAPCGALCKSNGHDEKKKRLSFVCRKQCLTSSLAVPNPIEACKYLSNECGYSTHISIRAYPRLICEIPRCSDRWKKIRNLRSASERSNGTTKSSDLDILDSPRIYGLAMASIEATMACITTLLKRMMRFVIGITLNLMRYLKTWERSYKKRLEAPKVPTFILSLIQRKRSPP